MASKDSESWWNDYDYARNASACPVFKPFVLVFGFGWECGLLAFL